LGALGADLIFEMDADLPHKPADIPRLLVNLEQGAISASAAATFPAERSQKRGAGIAARTP
jgi:hypothetical protein